VVSNVPGLALLSTIGLGSRYVTLPLYGKGDFCGDCM